MLKNLISHPAITKIIATETDIQAAVQKIANDLTEKFKDNKERPIFVAVLKGGVIFTTDLMRRMPIDVDMDFIDVKSYTGTESTGQIKVVHDLSMDITNRDVVVLDEIIDSGNTIKWLKDYMLFKGAKSVTTAVLVDKKIARVLDIDADFVGFEVPDEFIVGYGMDYNNNFRNLPIIAVIDSSKID